MADVQAGVSGAHLERMLEERSAALERAEQRAEEAGKSKGAFLANMSHELRTPMNGVIGLTDLLLDTNLSPLQHEYVTTIRESAQNLLKLVNAVLDYSRADAESFAVETVNVDVLKLVDDVVSSLLATARVKWLALDGHVAPEARTIIRSDAGKLRQILLNLVGNAIKFTDRGGVTIVATKRSMPDGRAGLRVDVMDTGIGIDASAKQKLFEPFTQADVSTTRKFGGTGLGLSISKQLVELLGGSIDCEGEVGKGSTFWFIVPFESAIESGGRDGARPAAARPGSAAAGAIGAAGDDGPFQFPFGRFRVLLAEDNKVNQLVATRMLEKTGVLVDVVENGVDAVAAVKGTRYDLVLMDCQMPELDGYGATREIRALLPQGTATAPTVPIVALTANVTDHDRQACLDAGMDDFLSKPVRRAELEDRLKHALLGGDASGPDAKVAGATTEVAPATSSGSSLPPPPPQRWVGQPLPPPRVHPIVSPFPPPRPS